MALHTLKLVNSIAASPTTRLDLNDGTIWRVTDFDASPPRLRRSMSQNAMTDGGFVSSSQYEMRTVKMTLFLNRSTQDLAATQLQTLARELDRADNYLMYQPNGATKPVFFRTVRSDFTSVREVPSGSAAVRAMEVEILAEPFALGLRETLGPFTVNNDTAASNGCYFDVTGVIGDVAAPFTMVDTTSRPSRFHLSVRQHGTPSALSFFSPAEVLGLGTDTTVPGGGPDAAMSGIGTNNFAVTTFATATMATRLTWQLPSNVDQAGVFRIFAVVRRSDSTSAMQVRTLAEGNDYYTDTITLPLTTNRQLVDLGQLTNTTLQVFTGASTGTYPYLRNLYFQASRTSGTGTLDWDTVLAIPADEAFLRFSDGNTLARSTSIDFVVTEDGVANVPNTFDVFTTGALYASQDGLQLNGAMPRLKPNQTNRLFLLTSDYSAPTAPRHTKADSEVLTLHYFPRYAYVRPSAT